MRFSLTYSVDLLDIIVSGNENPPGHRAVDCKRW